MSLTDYLLNVNMYLHLNKLEFLWIYKYFSRNNQNFLTKSIYKQKGISIQKLIGHLKSDDFFSVAKNPTAKLDITKVETKENNTIVNGKLTIKGITQDISFPASVSKKGNVVVAIATIRIDRTKYDIKYGSKSFIEGIGDKAIDDEFELQVNLVAIK